MANLFIKTYATTLTSGKPNYIEPKTAKGIVCDFLTAVSKRKQKEVLNTRTILKKNKLEILLDDPRHIKLGKDIKLELFEHMTHWLKNDEKSPYNYKVNDAVFRLAGTGSIGLKRYALLLKSLNNNGEKYLLIDMKQSANSSLQPYSETPQPSWNSEAERIVTIQRRMQNRPPALLSTTTFQGDTYVIQEMQPTKDSINFKLIKKNYRNMYQVIDDMATLTASSQLRSSGLQGSAMADDLIAFGQQDQWHEEILKYAIEYLIRIRKDYSIFLNDFKRGALNVGAKPINPNKKREKILVNP